MFMWFRRNKYSQINFNRVKSLLTLGHQSDLPMRRHHRSNHGQKGQSQQVPGRHRRGQRAVWQIQRSLRLRQGTAQRLPGGRPRFHPQAGLQKVLRRSERSSALRRLNQLHPALDCRIQNVIVKSFINST